MRVCVCVCCECGTVVFVHGDGVWWCGSEWGLRVVRADGVCRGDDCGCAAQTLRVLDLSRNAFTGNLPDPRLTQELRVLNAGHNLLAGTLTSKISLWARMQRFSVNVGADFVCVCVCLDVYVRI